MQNLNYPSYLLPLDEFKAVEVIGSIREKKDRAGEIKRETWTGKSLPGWVVPIEIIRGSRKKTLPNGKMLEIMDSETVNVTLWSTEKPDLSVGDYAEFSGLMAGAVDGKIYIQALKVEKIEADFDLSLGEN